MLDGCNTGCRLGVSSRRRFRTLDRDRSHSYLCHEGLWSADRHRKLSEAAEGTEAAAAGTHGPQAWVRLCVTGCMIWQGLYIFDTGRSRMGWGRKGAFPWCPCPPGAPHPGSMGGTGPPPIGCWKRRPPFSGKFGGRARSHDFKARGGRCSCCGVCEGTLFRVWSLGGVFWGAWERGFAGVPVRDLDRCARSLGPQFCSKHQHGRGAHVAAFFICVRSLDGDGGRA